MTYARFAALIATSTAAMYGLMYLSISARPLVLQPDPDVDGAGEGLHDGCDHDRLHGSAGFSDQAGDMNEVVRVTAAATAKPALSCVRHPAWRGVGFASRSVRHRPLSHLPGPRSQQRVARLTATTDSATRPRTRSAGAIRLPAVLRFGEGLKGICDFADDPSATESRDGIRRLMTRHRDARSLQPPIGNDGLPRFKNRRSPLK